MEKNKPETIFKIEFKNDGMIFGAQINNQSLLVKNLLNVSQSTLMNKLQVKASVFAFVLLMLFTCIASAQNPVYINTGDYGGFSWGAISASNLLSAGSANNTYPSSTNQKILTPSGTGNKYFRFASATSGWTNYGPTSADQLITSGAAPTTTANGGSFAYYLNIANATSNVVFNTNNGAPATAKFWANEVRGAIRTVSSVTQSPSASENIFSTQAVTITATLSGALSTGQAVYLRYSTASNFATSTVVAMNTSGTTSTATIPALAAAGNYYYYVFTSGSTTPSAADADLMTINFNNNGGSNYSYAVTAGKAYYWVGGTAPTSAFADQSNWSTAGVGGAAVGASGTAITFTTADAWIVDGNDVSSSVGLQTGTITVPGAAATQVVGQFKLINSANFKIVNLTTTRSYTVGTPTTSLTGTDLDIQAGSTLVVGCTGTGSGTSTQTLALLALNTANIAGVLDIGNQAGSASVFTIGTAGNATVANGGTYRHGTTSTTIPAFNWNTGSTIEITGLTGTPTTSMIQNFYNLIWNCSAQSTSIGLSSNLTTVLGDFTMANSNGKEVRLASSGSPTVNVSGNLIISGGILSLNSSSGATILNVGGNCNISAGTLTNNSANNISAPTINISGNLNISGTGSLDLQLSGNTNGSNNGIVNLSGNLNMTGGSITKTGTGTGTAAFNFAKSGTQTFSKTGGTISGNTTFNINSGSTVDFGTNILDGGSGAFNLLSGGGIITANTNATGALTTSGANGTIQLTGTRTYNTGTNFTFNGAADQVTGNGLPASINTLTVANTGSTNKTVTVTNAGTLAITSASSAALTLTSGFLKLQASTDTISIASGGGITATSGDFSSASLGGVKFLGTGTVTGTVNFYPAVVQAPSSVLGVTYSAGSTIQTSLTLNPSSYVNVTAPSYATNSTLFYNTGNSFTAGTEWTANATSGAGVPFNVTLGNGNANSSLNFGTSSNYRQCNGSFTLSSTSTLALSTVSGGDIKIGKNYTNNGGTLTSNSRAVFFEGATGDQTITKTGGETFDYLIINKAAGNVVLANAATINQTLTLTSGKLVLGNNNLTLSGSSSSISGPAAFGSTTSNYIVTNGTGNLIIQNIGSGARTGAVLFPIGASTSVYNPISFTNSGTSDNFSVRAAASVPGGLTSAYSVNNSWVIAEGTAGGSNATIGLQWIAADQNASFDRTNCAVVGTDGTTIAGTPTYGAASGSGPYTRTLSGQTTFSSFYGMYTPIPAVAPTVTTASASSITSTGASSGGNVTSDGGATITERGVVYATTTSPTTANTKVTATGTTGSFTSTLNGLTAGTTYYVRAYAINSVGTSYGSEVSFTTLAAPTVTTTSATSVTSSGASTGGNVTSDGGATITERGVVYSTSTAPTTADTKVTATGTTGTFSSTLNGLSPGITYYVRAYAINSVGTSYGSEITFTTTTLAPTVTTATVTSIAMTSASAGGNVTADGGATITERGVVYSTSAAPTTSDTKATSVGTTGSFTVTLSGLNAGTTYYVRAYAINSVGTSYGSEQSFTTLNIPTVTTTAASAITNNSASGGGNVTADGGSSITERGIVYSTSSNPTTSDTKIIDGSTTTGSFTSSISGLSSSTTYYVRAYAINAQGTAYGSNETFTTTSAALAPTVTTAAVTNLASSTVTVGGNVTSDGGDALTERGIVYSSSANPTTSDNKVADASATTGSFTAGLTSLTPGATYHVRAYAINSVGTSYGSDVSFTMNAVLATVSTTTATSITSSSAVSGGNVTADGGGTITERGIVYGTSPNPTTSNTKVVDGAASTGSFASTLNGLTQATTYYIRAYAINSAGTAYGSNESFTTLANAPTVTTTSISSIGGSTATGGGNVTSDGGASITERGVVVSTSSNPTTSDTKFVDGSATTGSFVSSLSSLSAVTTYYVRAYAINSIGTSYGSEVSFTTISAQPSVQASAVTFTNIAVNGMTINFTAGDGANSIVLVKSGTAVNSNPVNTTSYTANTTFGSGSQIGTGNYVVYNGSGNSVSITGLNPATTYYVAVYSFNGSGGTENYLTTSPATGNQTTSNTDYRSVSSGNWSSTSTWEKYNGSAWVSATEYPTSAFGNITIQAGHTVALDLPVTVDEMTIATSGQLTINAAQTLTVANGNGTDLAVNGTLKNQGTVTLSSSLIVVAGTYEHAVAAGTIPACSWSSGSTCLVTGSTGTTAPGGTAQNFHHFTWNCAGQTGNISLALNNNTIGGNFTVQSVGTPTTSALRLTAASTAATNNISINGNLVINAGLFTTHGSTSGTSAITVTVGGNTTIASGATLDLNNGNTATTTSTWNVSGNFSNAGTFKATTNASTSPLRFNSNATFTNTGTLTSGYLRVLPGVNLDFGTTLLNGGVSFTLDNLATMTTANTGAIISATGTISLGATANYVFNGASAQTLPASINTANNMTINNSAGVTLGAATSVAGTLTLTNGKLSLGNNTLTLSNAVSGASSSNYVVTNGTGLLKFSAVGSGGATYPIGNSTTNYTPFSLTNNGTSADIGVSVSSTITNALVTSAKAVALQWTVNSSVSTSNVNATFNWNTGNEGASFNNTGNGELGIYVGAGPYSKSSLGTLSGTSISKSGISLASGNNLMVIGNTNAIYIPAQVATGFAASSVTCNAMSVSWTPGTNADGTIVLYTSGATAPNTNPSAGTTYTAGNTIGNATVGYVGSGSSFGLSSLLENTNYNFKIFSFNGSGADIAYLTSSVLSGTQATAAIVAPTLAAASSISSTGFSTSWTSSSCANNYSLYVSSLTPDTVVAWTFPYSGTDTHSDSIASNANNYGSTNFSLSSGTIADVSGVTTRAASHGNNPAWSVIGKFWQVIVNATGYSNLTVSSSQQSSASGPKDFRIEYKIGSAGTWTAFAGDSTTSGNGSFVNVVNLPLPSACNDQSQLYLRWYNYTGARADGGVTAIGTGGTNRIDDIYIKGNLMTSVAGYNPATIGGTSASVTGLSANTNYVYYVQAVGSNSTSAASSMQTVITYADPAISDFRTKASGNFTDASIWEYKYDGTNWGAAPIAPSSGNNITIQLSDSVDMNTDLSLNSGKTMTVSGKIKLNTNVISGNGTFVLSPAASVYIGHANGLSGNLTITNVTRDASANYTYNGSVAQAISTGSNNMPATITGNLVIDNPAGVTLNLIRTINSPGKAIVKSNAKLSFGTGVGTAAYTLKGTGGFEAQSNSTLVITSSNGICAPGTPTIGDTLGSIRLTGSRSFASDVNYIFAKNDASTSLQSKTGYSFGTEITGVKNLTFDNPFGSRLTTNITVNGTLNLISGALNTDGFKIVIPSGGNVTKSDTSWVVGNLEKYVATGATSLTYEVGIDSLSYSPVSVTFGNVTTAGSLAAKAFSGDRASIASSGLDTTKSVNAYWSLTNTGVAFNNYSATFNFVSAMVDAGATPGSFVARNYTSGWTVPSLGTVTSSATQVTGMTNFGDFSIGESKGVPAISTQPTASAICPGSNTSFSVATTTQYPTYTVQWQRDAGGGFVNITADLDAGTTYSGFTSETLTLTGSTLALNGYTYRAVYTNFNGSANSDAATLTIQNNTWQGGSSSNFTLAANWTCGTPTAGQNLVVSSGTPTISTPFTVSSGMTLTLNGTASLIVGANAFLDVASGGSVDFGGKSVTVKSTSAGTGAIGKILGTLTGATNVTIERFIPQSRRAYRLLATNTTGQTINQAWQEGQIGAFSNTNPGYGTIITGRWSGTQTVADTTNVKSNGFDSLSAGATLWSYNPTSNAVEVVSNTNSTQLSSQPGFFLYVRGDRTRGQMGPGTGSIATTSTTLRSTGTMYQGSQQSSVGAGKFALLRNPYPSQIDMRNITLSSSDINAFYVWDPKRGTTGAYVTFYKNGENYVMGSGPGGSYAGSQNSIYNFIESGAAFFVYNANGSAQTVTVTENSKSDTSYYNVFRPIRPTAVEPNLLFSLYGEGNTEILDGGTVFFDKKYKNDVDGNDIRKLNNYTENIGVANGQSNLVVDRRGELVAGNDIDLRIGNMKQQGYKLEIEPINIVSDLDAYLVDAYLNTQTLLDLAVKNKYGFEVTGEAASSAANRFRIVFKARPVKVASFTVAPNPVQGKNMNLQLSNQPAGKYQVRLINMLGQSLYATTFGWVEGSGNQLIKLPASLAGGSYHVELTRMSDLKKEAVKVQID